MMVRREFLLAIGAVWAAGCSPPADKGTVSGTVTLDGRPLESGIIRFVPTDGLTATADAAITNGEYSAIVPLGDKRIEITAPEVAGKRKMYDTPDGPTVDIVRELLPARYNVRSELALTVEPGGREASFELHSK